MKMIVEDPSSRPVGGKLPFLVSENQCSEVVGGGGGGGGREIIFKRVIAHLAMLLYDAVFIRLGATFWPP